MVLVPLSGYLVMRQKSGGESGLGDRQKPIQPLLNNTHDVLLRCSLRQAVE